MKLSHSLSVSVLRIFLLKSPNRINSFSSFKTISIKSSNLSLYSILESGGLYMLPAKKDLPLTGLISDHKQEIE